jgi:long-subunit acyl-CoA synthetase (AMP-forming)
MGAGANLERFVIAAPGFSQTSASALARPPRIAPRSERPLAALIVFSSGSAGQPKGVVARHERLG